MQQRFNMKFVKIRSIIVRKKVKLKYSEKNNTMFMLQYEEK